MTSNTQFTASDITEDDYEVGEYILYKNKPYQIKSFKNNKAILQAADEVKSSEFNKDDNEIGEIVYLDEVSYQIKDFKSGKAILQFAPLSIINLDNEEQNFPTTSFFKETIESTEKVNEIGPTIVNNNLINSIYEVGEGPGIIIKETTKNIIETTYILPTETTLLETTKIETLQEMPAVKKETILTSNITETKNKISTYSIIKKEIISTKSELTEKDIKENESYIASKSNILIISEATPSIATKSILKKGDTDIYGNIIEYDINNWIGEDVLANNDNQSTIPLSQVIVKENDSSFLNNSGKLVINVKGIEKFKKTNIDLTILDDNYNLHIIRLLYKNNYSETFDVLCGHYLVYQINYSNSKRLNDLYVENKEFIINPKETQELNIYQNQMLLETQSVSEKNTNTFFNKSIFLIFISILVVLIISAAIMFFIRKKGK